MHAFYEMIPKTEKDDQPSPHIQIPFRFFSLLLLLVATLLYLLLVTAAPDTGQPSDDYYIVEHAYAQITHAGQLPSAVWGSAGKPADSVSATVICATCSSDTLALGDITLTALLIYALVYIALGSIRVLRWLKSGFLIFLSTTLATGPVIADVHRTLYLGMGSGMSRLTPAVENGEVTNRDKEGRLLHGFLGYELNEKISVELAYADLGKASLRPLGSVDYQDISVSGVYHINGAATSRQHKPYSLYGRLGVGTIQNQSDITIERAHNAHWLAGAGIQIPVSDRFAVRAEGTYYDSDASSVGVSVLYRIRNSDARQSEALVNAAPVNDTNKDEVASQKLTLASDSSALNTDTPDMAFEQDQKSTDDQGTLQAAASNTLHWLLNSGTEDRKQTDVLSMTSGSIETIDTSQETLNAGIAPAQERVSETASEQPDILDTGIAELSTSPDTEDAEDTSISKLDIPGNETPELAAAMPKATDEASVETTKGTDSPYEPVLFEFDSNELTMYGKEQLVPLVQHLSSQPGRQVILTGHTDDLGPDEYNQYLSQLRADAVKKFLLQQGIERKMIKTVGAGEKNPLKSNRTATGRMHNRRVEIVVV